MPLLVPGGGAYVNIPQQTQTPRSRRAAGFAARGATFFGSADGAMYQDLR